MVVGDILYGGKADKIFENSTQLNIILLRKSGKSSEPRNSPNMSTNHTYPNTGPP
jgi:hypothetical protein